MIVVAVLAEDGQRELLSFVQLQLQDVEPLGPAVLVPLEEELLLAAGWLADRRGSELGRLVNAGPELRFTDAVVVDDPPGDRDAGGAGHGRPDAAQPDFHDRLAIDDPGDRQRDRLQADDVVEILEADLEQ